MTRAHQRVRAFSHAAMASGAVTLSLGTMCVTSAGILTLSGERMMQRTTKLLSRSFFARGCGLARLARTAWRMPPSVRAMWSRISAADQVSGAVRKASCSGVQWDRLVSMADLLRSRESKRRCSLGVMGLSGGVSHGGLGVPVTNIRRRDYHF